MSNNHARWVRRVGIPVMVLLLLGWGVLSVRAQFSENIDIRFEAEQGETTVGDPVTLILSVTHPAGYQVTIGQLPQKWEQFEVLDQRPLDVIDNGDGMETTRYAIDVTLFQVGTFESGPLPIKIRQPSGEVIERAAPRVSVTVQSILNPDDLTLRDIKPQAVVEDPFGLLRLLGTLLGLLILAALGWWLYRRLAPRLARPAVVAQTPVYIDPRPAYQIAYDELARIQQLDLPGQGRFKEYYSLVTDCMRHYLGGMFGVPAIDLTTGETRVALTRSSLEPQHTRAFLDLLTEGDLVKFARYVPDAQYAREVIPRARHLVDVTKIAAEPEPPDTSDEGTITPSGGRPEEVAV